jgi:hypothetical protein
MPQAAEGPPGFVVVAIRSGPIQQPVHRLGAQHRIRGRDASPNQQRRIALKQDGCLLRRECHQPGSDATQLRRNRPVGVDREQGAKLQLRELPPGKVPGSKKFGIALVRPAEAGTSPG